jgi:tol-pal system protein YbgF
LLNPRLIASLSGAALMTCTILGAALAAEPLKVAQAAQGQGKAPAAAPAPGGSDSALKQRVEQLEEQIVDMQVVIGTLESLARGGGAAASGGGGSGVDSVRLDGLETQMRALSAQIEQLSDQVRQLGGQPRKSDAGGVPGGAPPVSRATADEPDAARFGSTTVTAGTGDAIGGLIEGEGPATPVPPAAGTGSTAAAAPSPGTGAPPNATGGQEMAELPPAFGAATAPNAADAGNAKQLYETAYGHLMQRDYGAAQAAFEDFLTRYPNDSLAGNAQYWLGEAHFVRGEYKAAAGSFLKGYQNYAGNARASDSLLKLAMSLDRLGQKDAACSSFSELSTRFPDAPENVKNRAKSERQRIGCR